MQVLLLAALLVAATYMFGIYMFGRRGQISQYTAGVEFLLLGALLNSGLIIDQPHELFEGLRPFVHLELAWIGMLYGIQYEWRKLKREPLGDFWLVGMEGFSTIILVFFCSMFIIPFHGVPAGQSLIPAAVMLAAGASISSPWTLSMVLSVQKSKLNLTRRLQLIAILDDIPGFLVFVILFFSCCNSFSEAVLKFAGGTFTGISIGIIVMYQLRGRIEEFEPLLVLIGSALLAAGISLALGIPVIYVTLVSGLVIANTLPRNRDIFPVLAGSEHLLYLLFLLIAGAFWNPTDIFALGLAVILIIIRYFSKWSSFQISRRFISIPGWSGKLASTLISPGGLAVAMVMNIMLFPERFLMAQLVLDVTVWTLIILSPVGLPLARRAILKLEAEQ